MYEFTSKEIRNEFKKTEYGKKLNKSLRNIIIIDLLIFVLAPILIYLTKDTDLVDILLLFLVLACVFAGGFLCYIDGKRDGAIEQFKISKIKH